MSFLVLIVFICAAISPSTAVKASSPAFVRTNASQLVVDGVPFYFLGANSYWLIDWPNLVDPFFLQCNVIT